MLKCLTRSGSEYLVWGYGIGYLFFPSGLKVFIDDPKENMEWIKHNLSSNIFSKNILKESRE